MTFDRFQLSMPSVSQCADWYAAVVIGPLEPRTEETGDITSEPVQLTVANETSRMSGDILLAKHFSIEGIVILC